MNKKVILGVFSGLIISLAGVAQSPQNYKQQNHLVGSKKEVKSQAGLSVVHHEAFTTNPLQNHGNYKAFQVVQLPKTLNVQLSKSGDRHRNYKQKNLLTKSNYPLVSRSEEQI